MLETMPGLRIEVISSSTSVISAMMAKIPVRQPALPRPTSAVKARIGTSPAPSCETASMPRIPARRTGAPIMIVIFLEL